MQYSTEEETSSYLTTAFTQRGMPEAVAEELGQHLVTAFEEVTFPNPSPGTFAMMVPRIRWVIRDDDLLLLDAVSDGVLAAISTGWILDESAGTQATVAGIAGVAAASLRVLNQIRRKGARISARNMKVLLALDSSERALSIEEMVEGLDDLSREEVIAAFEELQKVRLRDGTVESLIAQDATGSWSASGV